MMLVVAAAVTGREKIVVVELWWLVA